MKTKIKLKVTQTDLIEKKTEIIYQGLANMSESSIHYQEDKDTNVTLFIEDKNWCLERKSKEIHSKLIFALGRLTQGQVLSEYGLIELEIKTIELITEENRIYIFYEIINSENLISRFKLKWEWTYEQH